MDPDVSPEGQAHDVQVIASVAEGTGEVDEHCQDKERKSYVIFVEPQLGVSSRLQKFFLTRTFSAFETRGVDFDNALCG